MPTLIGIALWALIPGFIAKKKGRNFWGYYFLSFLISPLITMIITLCLSKITESEYLEEVPTETDKVRFCRKCGEKLIDSSKFCRKCGTEIVEEPAIAIVELENIEFCKKCGADITNDTDTCHVCGEQKGID